MNLQVGVKALIQNKKGEFLFLRRAESVSTDTHETSWDIPGGRIDADEALIDALKREIKEEIGYDVSNAPKLIASQDIFVAAKDMHVVRLTYAIEEDISDIQLSSEHDDYQWVDKSSFAAVNTEPYLSEVLSNLL